MYQFKNKPVVVIKVVVTLLVDVSCFVVKILVVVVSGLVELVAVVSVVTSGEN